MWERIYREIASRGSHRGGTAPTTQQTLAATQHYRNARYAKKGCVTRCKTLLIDRANPFRLRTLCPMLPMPPQGVGESISIDSQ